MPLASSQQPSAPLLDGSTAHSTYDDHTEAPPPSQPSCCRSAVHSVRHFNLHSPHRGICEALVVLCWAVLLVEKIISAATTGSGPTVLWGAASPYVVMLMSLLFIALCWNNLSLPVMRLLGRQLQFWVIVAMMLRASIAFVALGAIETADKDNGGERKTRGVSVGSESVALDAWLTFSPLGAFLFLDALKDTGPKFRVSVAILYSLQLAVLYGTYSFGMTASVDGGRGNGTSSSRDGMTSRDRSSTLFHILPGVQVDAVDELTSSFSAILGVSVSFVVNGVRDATGGRRFFFPISRVTFKDEAEELLNGDIVLDPQVTLC